MKQPWKRGFAASLALLSLAAGLSGCSSGLVNNVNTGEINPNTEQTEFDIMGGISALSSGYENNEVLKKTWASKSTGRPCPIPWPSR